MKYILIASMLFMAACNDQAATTDETSDKTDSSTGITDNEKDKTVKVPEGCYRQVLSRDTVNLQLTATGNEVTGTLHFDNFEKDASRGTVRGKIDQDRLIVWYDFNSEGMHSVMEIIYKVKDDQLIRAVGDMEGRGDSVFYKSHEGLTYDVNQTLIRINCQ